MCRSSWKPIFFSKSILKYLNAISLNKLKKNKKFRVFSRSSVISPLFKDFIFSVHSGKLFFTVNVSNEKLNLKFGEFSFSKKRSFLIHSHNKITKKNISKKWYIYWNKMGHLINPISFRLTRNRFWSLILLYKTNIKNIYFFIKLICWFIKYIFIKFFFILPIFKINQFNLKYNFINDFFDYNNLLRFLIKSKKNKVLSKFLRNSFKLSSNLFINKVLASVVGFNKDVLFIRVSFLDLMFNLFISYKLFRPFFRQRFSFLVNFIRLFKKKKTFINVFFFILEISFFLIQITFLSYKRKN